MLSTNDMKKNACSTVLDIVVRIKEFNRNQRQDYEQGVLDNYRGH